MVIVLLNNKTVHTHRTGCFSDYMRPYQGSKVTQEGWRVDNAVYSVIHMNESVNKENI